jgi:membrane-associated protease RseP (regulator of RpoE activity)
MTRSWIPLALGALLLAPAAANAQEENVMVFASPGRPRIGVMVDASASDANNKLGATIKSVTPDGPAAKAGLEAGDIITKFGGTSLGGEAPGQKLVELAQALSPGDTVKVEYRRGTANRTATVVAADLGGAMYSWRSGPDGDFSVQLAPLMKERARAMADRELAFVDMDRALGEMGRNFDVRIGGGAFGLDMAEMNAGLGEYFGTAKGVLILENPSDSTMPLKAGDVILAIDGRTPADVGQARRILGSYDSGDVAKFEIMRMKKKTTVSWTVPARSHMRLRSGPTWQGSMSPRAPAAPGSAPKVRVMKVPSASPAAPAAPAPTTVAPAPPAART